MNLIKFCEHVQLQEGFVLSPAQIKADGKWHNCRLVDNARGKAAGAYKILNDSVAFYKNWRDGKCKLYTDKTIVNKHEQESLRKIIKQHEVELKQQYFKASKLAYEKYMKIADNSEVSCPYLLKKQIGNYGCKVDKSGDLIIPYYNENGYLRTLQTIKPSGVKLYELGAELQGNYHKIGFSLVDKVNEKYFGRIFIGEGYSTMASVYEATKYPCVVSAQSTNLANVAEKIAKLYPNAQLYICADNDLYLRETKAGNGKWIWDNPGVQAAIKTSQKVDCKIIIPDFSHLQHEHGLTDFNDLHCDSGLGAVKKQIMQGIMKLNSNTKRLDLSQNLNSDILFANHEGINSKVTLNNDLDLSSNDKVLDYYEKIDPNLISKIKQAGVISLPGVNGGTAYLSDNHPEYLASLLKKATMPEIEIDEVSQSNPLQQGRV